MPPFEGLDAAAVTRAAVAQGAESEAFAALVAAGQAAGESRPLDLIAIAAWRAGAITLRADALARLRERDSDDVAAALLGCAPHEVAEFVERQAADRWFMPGSDGKAGYVCSVGGFAGIGGAFRRPVEEGVALADDGAFAVREGPRWWRIDADVWCARLVPLDAAPREASGVVPLRADEPVASAMWADGVRVSLMVPPQTHLAWLYVERA